tara:strand:- start:203 stop:1315 length:1113 start_codon:yes stop_codon:yes gene_type:complete
MEAIEQTWNGSASLGGSVSATVSRNGDLVYRMYLQYNPKTCQGTMVTNKDFASNFSHNLIKEVEVEIGGQRIDRQYGHWLQVWSDLTEHNPSGAQAAVTATGAEPANNTTSTLFQNMSYNHTGLADISSAGSGAPEQATVPLQFWFNRNPGLALPLIALQYHEVKIKVTFSAFTDVMETAGVATDTFDLSTHKLWADYIYLDTDERRRFAQVSHEYLIEQVQFQNESSSKTFDLNFNHPVKELIWTKPATTPVTAIAHGSANSAGLEDGNYQLKLNGHDRFAQRDKLYFTRTQVWENHSGYGGIVAKDSIAVYSFALKPEEHQPSGTCNFSRIDNAQLSCDGTAQELRIYAVNYNVLRIMSGMGGLAYSN